MRRNDNETSSNEINRLMEIIKELRQEVADSKETIQQVKEDRDTKVKAAEDEMARIKKLYVDMENRLRDELKE